MTLPDNAELLQTIDSVVRNRVVIYGSLPPEGRDLDLLVRPDDAAAIADRLRADTFRAWGRGWVLFKGCSARLVELIPVATLRLPEDERDALFAEGIPLPRLTRVLEPAPHHVLLILARRLAREPRLVGKYRTRIERAVARDPRAWAKANDRAALWKAERALARLRQLYSEPDGAGRFHWRSLLRPPRRTRLIGLSGTNPDRTSSHAQSLRETLDRLGFDVVVERPCSRRSRGSNAPQPRARARDSVAGESAPDDGAWPPLVATAASLSLWWPVLRRLTRGTVLIYEWSALDVAVWLPGGITTQGRLGRSARLLRRLAPTPLRSYVLEEVLSSPDRQAEEHRYAEAYHAAAKAFGARLLDADRPADHLCAQIAEDVWLALIHRTALESALRNLVAVVGRRRSRVEAVLPPSRD